MLRFFEIVASVSEEKWVSGFVDKSVALRCCKELVGWSCLALPHLEKHVLLFIIGLTASGRCPGSVGIWGSGANF